MEIKIEKIIQKLALSEYAAEYGDQVLHVWVNPARKMLQKRIQDGARGEDLRAELDALRETEQSQDDVVERMRNILVELNEIGSASLSWMAEILSQGPEDTQMNADEITAFVADCEEFDPKFYPWISTRVWQMISDYRNQKKKA